MQGRILFPGNPWPAGHRIKELTWGGTLHPLKGLGLHFELKSADYYEGEDDGFPFTNDVDEALDDWAQKAAWANYHACHIGPSMTSDSIGIPMSEGEVPFRFDAPSYEFRADPLPASVSDVFGHGVFGIYLLGHDACADHHIRLARSPEDHTYRIDWTGRIALAYAGGEAFKYNFRAEADGVRFDAISLWHFMPKNAKEHLGIDIDPDMSPRDWIAPYVADPEHFRFEDRNGTLHAVRLSD